MANPWFRLWADMVNDPKWRTIARVSQQEISRVISVYLHMMTCASNAAERGQLQGWCDEDIATALDIETEEVGTIRCAMQDRVLDGEYLTGWQKRQPLREREGDNSTDRVKAFRDRQRLEGEGNATKRQETPREEEIREEEKKEEKSKAKAPAAPKRKPAKVPLPEDFSISPSVRQWAEQKGFTRLQDHFDSFVRKCRAKGYTYADWDQAFQNAVADDWANLNVPQARASPGPHGKFDPVAHVNRNRNEPNEQPFTLDAATGKPV